MKLEETTLKELIEKYKKQPRRNVLNASFTSPTSLPLYFYFGYQLLEESTQWQECGHVRSLIRIMYLDVTLTFEINNVGKCTIFILFLL